MEEENKKTSKFGLKTVASIVAVILILAGIGGTYYFYTQNKKSQALLKDPTAVQQAETKEILKKLAEFMILPTDEEPSVATVLDADQLKSQSFFAQAENGDKVIVYTKADKAILYRPGTNKIVNVSTVNLEQPSTVKVAVYNGTKVPGLTTRFATDITNSISSVVVSSKANAERSDYQQSIVVDLTGQNTELAQQIADLIEGTVSGLPEGEVKPSDSDTGLLIILGASYVSPVASSPTPTVSPIPATP